MPMGGSSALVIHRFDVVFDSIRNENNLVLLSQCVMAMHVQSMQQSGPATAAAATAAADFPGGAAAPPDPPPKSEKTILA